MRTEIILLTILVVAVRGDEWGLIHFNKNYSEFRQCLQNGTLRDIFRIHVGTAWLEPYILHRLAAQFSGRTVEFDHINVTTTALVNILLMHVALNDNQRPPVRWAFINGIIRCSDNEVHDYRSRIEDQSSYFELPHFVNEEPEVANLLNFILVDLEYFFDGSTSLRTFFSYAQRVLPILQDSLTYMESSYDLCIILRRMFDRRADLFFDANDTLPYIRHNYTLNWPRPHTRDDPSLFVHRRRMYNRVRNPQASQAEIMEILNTHPRDWKNHNRGLFYSLHSRFMMTKSRYYYEIHENRFVRAMFLYLELVERGLVGLYHEDSNDLLPSQIPNDLMQILYNDTVYNNYLEIRNIRELGVDERLFGGEYRIDEARLILFFWNRLRYILTTTIRTNTTISSVSTSSTPVYRKSRKGKGLVGRELISRGSSGKWIPKSRDSDDETDCDKPGPSCSKRFKFARTQKENCDKSYGYSVESDNQENLSFNELQNILLGILKRDVRIH